MDISICKSRSIKSKMKLRAVVLDITSHFIVAALLSLVIYFKYINLTYISFFIAGAILIDLDHFIDHFLYYGLRFNLKDFFTRRFLSSGRVYIILHSWELCIIAAILGFIFESVYLLLFSLGISVHLLVDYFNSRSIFFHFLIYRIVKGFRIDELLPNVREKFI